MTIPSCHPERKHRAKGLCGRCYDAKWKRDKRTNDSIYAEKNRAALKAWHKANPEYDRARSRRRYKENPDKYKALISDWWKRHPEKRKEYRTRHKAKNPEHFMQKMREYVKKRKALKKGAAIRDFTASQWENMKLRFNNCCFYCGDAPEQLTQDHMIPLSRGGNHTEANIVPACMDCNNRKGTKTMEEFHVVSE